MQSYVSNIGLTLDVEVSAQIAEGAVFYHAVFYHAVFYHAVFYHMEGFEHTPQNGTIQVGLAPVFAESMLVAGNPIPATSTWGLTILALLVLATGTICYPRGHATLIRC